MVRFAKLGLVGFILPFLPVPLLTMTVLTALCVPGLAQDYSVLRINEIIADNKTQLPVDIGGSTTDMIEIYNTGDVPLTLGTNAKPDLSLALTDTDTMPVGTAFYTFRDSVTIPAHDFIIVFCDGNLTQDACEPHANFNINSDGSEPISLWGPVGEDGKRQLLDQVWLPPLPADVSFGRFPDGAGAAPVPLDKVMETFFFHPPDTSTLGSCVQLLTPCGGGFKKRFCRGSPNTPGGNLKPHVDMFSHSTNNPSSGQGVKFVVKVEDEKEPTPPNITKVQILYRVNGGAENAVNMQYDSVKGIQQADLVDTMGHVIGPNPFQIWTLWNGEIPAQLPGSRVEFYFRVEDKEGASHTSPIPLCAEGIGPCDLDFGGPGCDLDPNDKTCKTPELVGQRYITCDKPFTYTTGYTPRGDFVNVVINEVVPRQDGLLKDTTEPDFDPAEGKPCDPDKDMCPGSNPECCKSREDFLELHNTSSTVTVDLSGSWLSDHPFNPHRWQFPQGSSLGPGEYLIVWLDNDGGKCPDPLEPNKPCFWECPDPTNPAVGSFHTNFAINADQDEIFLFDDEAHKFGILHGVEFTGLTLNHSLSLVPDGDRNGCWLDSASPTPSAPNTGSCAPKFIRGDSKSDCDVGITDAIFTLNFLFSGGGPPPCPDSADADDNGRMELTDAIFTLGYLFRGTRPPPPPGPNSAGEDPTPDSMGPCNAPSCN